MRRFLHLKSALRVPGRSDIHRFIQTDKGSRGSVAIASTPLRPVSISLLSSAGLPKLIFAGLLAAVSGLAGCAPAGVSNNRSLGAAEQTPTEVVVVEAEADPEQARADEVRRQRREIAQLREQLSADRSQSEAATARAEAAALEAQASIRDLQRELAEVRARADTASAQSSQALATATEFLSNLVAAREEQRAIVERNMQRFNALDRRIREMEGRVTEGDQQRQAGLAQAGSRSSELEARLQRADQDLAQLRSQLTELYRENEQTREAIDSGPMLRMLRDLEATQRETTILRGLVEDLQREQQEGRKRLQDYYLDLDTRIQGLQDRERKALEDDVRGSAGDGDLGPGASSVPDGEGSGSLPGEIMKSGEFGEAAGERLEAYEDKLQRLEESASPADAASPAVTFDHASAGEAVSGTAADAVEPLPVTVHGVIMTDWTIGSVQSSPAGSQ